MRSLIFAASLLLATPCLATEWMYCGNADDSVTVGVLLGTFQFASVSGATMRIGEEAWSSAEVYGPGESIQAASAFIGDDQVVIDFADADYNETLAQLRVYIAEEGEDYVQGGVLRVAGRGAWVVTCEGP
jgi:hypothetical protein